ncbi:hypothetical protein HMSSN036_26300 [Paenibacillus macerans]|nr:hypothetical protein HMSSN036_26300 [Paenibacillus macerans]
MERIAELYYILAANGDTSSENFQMAKQVLDKWIDWSMDYVFVDSRPASDADGYYLDEQGHRVLGGQDPQIAAVEAPGELWIPGNLEWQGQPETWNGFDNYDGNPNLHVVTKDPGQDFGVIGSYVKALTFYAAGTKAENGKYTELGEQAEKLAKNLLDASWNYNDGVGITKPEPRKDYYRYFTKEIYFPAGWSGKYGQGNTIPGTNSVPSDPSKGATAYISVIPIFFRRSKTIPIGNSLRINTIRPGMRKPENGKTARRNSLTTASGRKSTWPRLMPNTTA